MRFGEFAMNAWQSREKLISRCQWTDTLIDSAQKAKQKLRYLRNSRALLQ